MVQRFNIIPRPVSYLEILTPEWHYLEIRDADEPPSDEDYWLTKSMGDRFEAVETIRQYIYGYDPVTATIPKIFEIVERS